MSLNKENFSFIVHIAINGTTGSGVLYKTEKNLYLVTAKHVLLDTDNELIGNNITVIAKNINEGIETSTTYEVEIDDLENIIFTDDINTDLIALKIEEGEKTLINNNTVRPYVTENDIVNFDNISVLKTIYIGGCPTSLSINVNDYDITRPSFRRGIISSIYEKDFIIDCPTYYGMSGGPVFIENENGEIQIIGVISKLVPLLVQWYNNRERAIINTDFENSGFSICVKLSELISKLN
jgi:V8-like Glu-specific endopeptidase